MNEHVAGSTVRDAQDDRLKDPAVLALVQGKISLLRRRLLDFTRKNPLVDLRFRPNATTNLRVVDELPDVLRHSLTQGAM